MNYLPQPYIKFEKEFPQLNEVYRSLAMACHEAGPLDERARRLVKLGIAIGCQSEGAVKSHARRAMEMGVSPEEVRHTALLGMTTIGFPSMIAALRWLDEVVEARE